jgi:hypothetical protein
MRILFRHVLIAVLIAATVAVPSPGVRATEMMPQSSALAYAGGFGGNVWAVAQHGRYAYLGEGNRLAIWDVHDPAQVVRVGQVGLSAPPYKLVLAGSAVAAFQSGPNLTINIELIDVTNPWQPTLRARYSDLSAATSFGTLLYLKAPAELRIVDLQDAAHPALRGRYDFWATPSAMLATSSMLYLLSGAALETFDVARPDAPQRRGSVALPGPAYALDNVGALVYLGGEQRVWVVDASDPTALRMRGSSPLEGVARSIEVVDGTAFIRVSVNPSELATAVTWIDVRNPAAIETLGTYEATANTSLVSPDGFVYVGTPSGLAVLDASDPRRVTARAEYALDGGVNDLALAGQRVYIAAQLQGLRVLDMSNPDKPDLFSGYTPLLVSASELKVAQGIGFVSDGTWLVLLDPRDPANPTPHARFALNDGLALAQVQVDNGIAYVALKGSLWLLDIRDPSAPALLSRIDGPADDVAVAGGVAIVAAGSQGLTVVDVSDPMKPLIVATYATLGTATRVWRNGDIAYVVDTAAGILVVDLSQPSAPRLRGSYPLRGGDIAIVGALAYVLGIDSLEIIDLSAPEAPRSRGSTPAPYGKMWVEGDRIYINGQRYLGHGNYITLLAVVDVQNPDQPRQATTQLGGFGTIVPFGNLVFFTRYTRNGLVEFQMIDATVPGSPSLLDQFPLACSPGPHNRVGDLLYLACGAAGLMFLRVQRQLLPVQARIGPSGGELRSFDGGMRLVLPPVALPVSATLRYQGLREPTRPLPLTEGVVHAFTLMAVDDAGAPVELQRSATLTLTYSTSMLTAASIGSEASLALVRWDGSVWQRLTPCAACSFDPAEHRLTVPIGAVGEYALVGERTIVMLPLVQQGADQ